MFDSATPQLAQKSKSRVNSSSKPNAASRVFSKLLTRPLPFFQLGRLIPLSSVPGSCVPEVLLSSLSTTSGRCDDPSELNDAEGRLRDRPRVSSVMTDPPAEPPNPPAAAAPAPLPKYESATSIPRCHTVADGIRIVSERSASRARALCSALRSGRSLRPGKRITATLSEGGPPPPLPSPSSRWRSTAPPPRGPSITITPGCFALSETRRFCGDKCGAAAGGDSGEGVGGALERSSWGGDAEGVEGALSGPGEPGRLGVGGEGELERGSEGGAGAGGGILVSVGQRSRCMENQEIGQGSESESESEREGSRSRPANGGARPGAGHTFRGSNSSCFCARPSRATKLLIKLELSPSSALRSPLRHVSSQTPTSPAGEFVRALHAFVPVESRPWQAYERQCAVALQVPSKSGESTPLASSPSQSSFFPVVPLTATTSQPQRAHAVPLGQALAVTLSRHKPRVARKVPLKKFTTDTGLVSHSGGSEAGEKKEEKKKACMRRDTSP